MNMTPVVVQDYASRPPVQNHDLRNMKQRLSDTHKEAVSAGPKGPVVLLTAFVSSTLVLLYQGTRFLYRRALGK